MSRIRTWIKNKINVSRTRQFPEDIELEKHTLPNGKYKLKFYDHGNGRYNVQYRGNYMCFCNKDDIGEVQSYFDDNFNGDNVEKISDELRTRYNVVKKQRKPMKKGTSKRRRKTYKTSNLSFENRKNGRMQVRVMDKGKTHSLCCCYPYQREQVIDKFNYLKKDHTLDEIKKILKDDYNIRKTNKQTSNHNVSINSNGMVWKDGQFVKVDSKLFDLIDEYI